MPCGCSQKNTSRMNTTRNRPQAKVDRGSQNRPPTSTTDPSYFAPPAPPTWDGERTTPTAPVEG